MECWCCDWHARLYASFIPGVTSLCAQVILLQSISGCSELKAKEVRRQFPVAELLGSECVLARMWHEHNVSKQYTPISLGEIIQRRSFTASGEVNPLVKSAKKSTALSLDEEQHLVQSEDPEWAPKSLLAIIDGVTAAKWAMVLTQWAKEHTVAEYAAWMIQRARSRPSKIEQFITYWTSASWSLAMALRTGKTFEEATSSIMADLDKFTEHMAKEPSSVKIKPPVVEDVKGKGKWGSGRNKGAKGDKEKGNYRYGPAGKNDRWSHDGGSHWQSSPYWQRSSTQPNRQGTYQDSFGIGTRTNRNRDSSGPQVPNTILRYPAHLAVRNHWFFIQTLKCRVTRSLFYLSLMALARVFGRCRRSSGLLCWLCPRRWMLSAVKFSHTIFLTFNTEVTSFKTIPKTLLLW